MDSNHNNRNTKAGIYPNTNHSNHGNYIDIHNKDVLYLNNGDARVYGGMNGETYNLTNAINPFAAALNVWQGYVKSWNDACGQYFSKTPISQMSNSGLCIVGLTPNLKKRWNEISNF
jgi:hypothetical protein